MRPGSMFVSPSSPPPMSTPTGGVKTAWQWPSVVEDVTQAGHPLGMLSPEVDILIDRRTLLHTFHARGAGSLSRGRETPSWEATRKSNWSGALRPAALSEVRSGDPSTTA